MTTHQEQILADLLACQVEGRCEFELLNTYKGTPLIVRATLQDVSEESARFEVQPPFSVCLSWLAYTLVLSDGTLEPISARVESFDILSGTAILDHFTYAGYHFGHRCEVRVEPAEPMLLELEGPHGRLQGIVRDISMGGVGAQVRTSDCDPAHRKGDTVRVTIHLPGKTVNLTGRLLSIVEVGDTCRLAVAFTGNGEAKSAILHYIFQRRDELIQEVERAYVAAYQVRMEDANSRH